ncbi:hypothetical protein [Rhizobium leguminosarum]|uniref:Uncharacterized protein n=1 Tax=Rhizobium leguminosarum TaxID=384 RepID=A0A7K3VG39_RHILE|nr:hypothetical protein [Rhizobium leguminosarum]NEK16119.1 hypothetical protein [Rhizobium leguminosarum]NEK34584.1 hypothetical protein [Rhizobium leguminosarum]
MNSQTNKPFLEWNSKDLMGPPRGAAQQIIVTVWNEELEIYDYNIVAYYKPMDLWYGGPGVLVKEDEIQYWAEIPGPPASPVDPGN